MIGFVLPTRDRPGELHTTLAALAALEGPGGAPLVGEVLVVDNASSPPAECPEELGNGLRVRTLRCEENRGAAARNLGVLSAHPDCEWVIMLDDDSAPLDTGFLEALAEQPAEVAAVLADITLPDGSREQGGLPEVPIGCGVAVRRWAFLAADGYDESFGYYAEEYDLAAKLLHAGRRLVFDPRFRVLHRKVTAGRDMNLILERLMRNNAWVLQRHCPEVFLAERLKENEMRYRAIAEKEHAVEGFSRGLAMVRETLATQPRHPMAAEIWDRFTGLTAARDAIGKVHSRAPFRSAAIVSAGKNAWVVRKALAELGVTEVSREDAADAIVIGTMSPGPMLDAAAWWIRREASKEGARVVVPWMFDAPRSAFAYLGGVELRRAYEDRAA